MQQGPSTMLIIAGGQIGNHQSLHKAEYKTSLKQSNIKENHNLESRKHRNYITETYSI